MALVGYKFGTRTMGTMVPHKFSFVDSVPQKEIRALRYGELENNRTKERTMEVPHKYVCVELCKRSITSVDLRTIHVHTMSQRVTCVDLHRSTQGFREIDILTFLQEKGNLGLGL